VLACTLASAGSAARAETPTPHVLRMAAVAPEGSSWARELKTFARDVEAQSAGALKVRWYFGGIAGDDVQTGERVRREQLDGVASAGMLCMRLAPSIRVLWLLGLFQSRQESAYVMGRLKPTLDAEFSQSGFVNLAEAGLGAQVIFSRQPVRSLADLRRGRFWIWNLDEVLRAQVAELGMQVESLPLDQASRAYDEGRIDGFIAIPTAALAFQWSAQARYLADLHMAFLPGCLLVANRAFDPLPLELQQVVHSASAKLQMRFEALGRTQDEALLGGLFARQGLQPVPVSDAFRSEFFESARSARDRLGERLMPRALVTRVLEMVADYRAEHGSEGKAR
jgi:TRAP-type C4-dicarboxylate transport system substrate-binding protein